VKIFAIVAALLWGATGSATLAAGADQPTGLAHSQETTAWHLDSLDGLEVRGVSEGGADAVQVHSDVVDYEGRRAVRIVNEEGPSAGPSGAQVLALVRASSFRNGIIELNVAGNPRPGAKPGTRGFVGVAFRVQNDEKQFESFYLRMTNGRAQDQLQRNHSAQYFAQPDYPWNRLRSENPGVYESYVDLVPGAWTLMRIQVAGTTARLYVNGAPEPCLIVNDLKLGQSAGAIALWVGSDTVAYFSDLSVNQVADLLRPSASASQDQTAAARATAR
jgi:hypothetical protein